jgi:hypothetical protein
MDPRNREVFYVGKGKENRIFQHLACAILETADENQKLDRIREIQKNSFEIQHYILRHGLSEDSAFEVEAALIDFINFVGVKLGALLNVMAGRYSSDYGIKTVDEVAAQYEADGLEADDPLILININRQYRREMTSEELYQATRRSWVVSKRREHAMYVIAHYRGLTREAYKIEKWQKVPEDGKNRWAFEGALAPEPIRNKYRYKSIKSYFKEGAANPIKYVKC